MWVAAPAVVVTSPVPSKACRIATRSRRNTWSNGLVVMSDASHLLGFAFVASPWPVLTNIDPQAVRFCTAATKDVGARPEKLPEGRTSKPPRPLHRSEIQCMPLTFAPSQDGNRLRRVVCYGDSLTAGFCNSGVQFEPYGRTLVKELKASGIPCEVIVSGHNGRTAKEMVAALSTSILDVVELPGKGLARILDEDAPPDIVIIMAGTNDMGKGAKMEAIAQDVARLHAACHRRGVPTIALVPPPAPSAPPQRENCRLRLQGLLEEWAAGEAGVEAVLDPGQWAPSGGSGIWDADGLHFCPGGSILLGQSLAPHVAKLLSGEECVVGKCASSHATVMAETEVHSTSRRQVCYRPHQRRPRVR